MKMSIMPEYAEHERIPMQYLIVDAAQDPTYAHERQYPGATVGCWIKHQTKRNAYLIAKGWIEGHGWVPLSLEEQYPVSAETYRVMSEGRKYFEQALIDEEVFVFFTSPEHEKAAPLRPSASAGLFRMLCEHCQVREATAHFSAVAWPSGDVTKHLCETCYPMAEAERTASYCSKRKPLPVIDVERITAAEYLRFAS